MVVEKCAFFVFLVIFLYRVFYELYNRLWQMISGLNSNHFSQANAGLIRFCLEVMNKNIYNTYFQILIKTRPINKNDD